MEMFETIIIFQPNEVTAKEEIRKFTDIIQDWNKTKKVRVEDMGIKKLAYEIKHNTQGYYAVFTYQCDPVHIQELERHLRIDERVLKFLTVKNSNLPDLEDYMYETRSEQKQKPDALDVLLGFATY